jgi:hypothetical protein
MVKKKQKTEKKKPGIITFVFGCIGTALLLVFFVGGIVYSVLSWIGVIVFGLFLANVACCVIIPPLTKRKQMPKRYRRVGLYVCILLILFIGCRIFWPDRGTWQFYTFDAELAAIEEKRAIPDDQNAALLYESLLAEIDLEADQPDFIDECGREPFSASQPWKESEHPEVLEWLNNHADILEQLKLVSKMDLCHFAVCPEPFASLKPELSDRYEKLEFCANLLLSVANRDIAKGNVEPAVRTYLSVIKLAKHCSQQPTITDFFLGSAIEQQTLMLIFRAIVEENLTDSQLRIISEAVNTQDSWSKAWPPILEVEKLSIKNFYGHAYEVNQKGKVRISRGVIQSDDVQKSLSDWEIKLTNKIASITMPLHIPYHPETVSRVIDNAYEKYKDAALPSFNWDEIEEYEHAKNKQLRRLYSMRLILPFVGLDNSELSALHRCYMRLTARRRACRIFTGLRLYKNNIGVWPQKLEDVESLVPSEALIDPINGGPFVYKLTDDSFMLYSRGKNNIDEGGEYKSNWPEKAEPDDWLIWYP